MLAEKENVKRESLLDTGRRLFWKYGFRRVTVNEICKEADVSKMTFYRFFENKTDLAKTIFDREVKNAIDKFNEIIKSDISASEKMKNIIQMKIEGTNDISSEFLMDFYRSSDTGLKEYVEEVTRNSWKEIIEGFRYAQQRGWFRKDFKPEFLFHISQKLVSIWTDVEMMKLYNSPQDLILEFANFFAYGISPHD
jgi:AcrR family transcriptional regulator